MQVRVEISSAIYYGHIIPFSCFSLLLLTFLGSNIHVSVLTCFCQYCTTQASALAAKAASALAKCLSFTFVFYVVGNRCERAILYADRSCYTCICLAKMYVLSCINSHLDNSSSDCCSHSTIDSCYLEVKGTLENTSRYPYFDISELLN